MSKKNEMKLFDRVIIAFETKSVGNNVERALYHLLLLNRDHIEDLIEDVNYFHKAFRQIDVTETGEMDMAIYALLDEAEIFWSILIKEAQKEKENKS